MQTSFVKCGHAQVSSQDLLESYLQSIRRATPSIYIQALRACLRIHTLGKLVAFISLRCKNFLCKMLYFMF